MRRDYVVIRNMYLARRRKREPMETKNIAIKKAWLTALATEHRESETI